MTTQKINEPNHDSEKFGLSIKEYRRLSTWSSLICNISIASFVCGVIFGMIFLLELDIAMGICVIIFIITGICTAIWSARLFKELRDDKRLHKTKHHKKAC